MASATQLVIDKDLVLAKIQLSPAYRRAVSRAVDQRIAERARLAAEDSYNAAVRAVSGVLAAGETGVLAGRKQLVVPSPNGRRMNVPLRFWEPLTPRWLQRKAMRNSRGRDKFWLDTGALSMAFSQFANRRYRVLKKVSDLETVQGKDIVTIALYFEKLPRLYLDSAIRRSFLQGVNGERGSSFQPLAGSPTGKSRKGLTRGFWPEAIRPMMRPIANRYGRELISTLVQNLKRRR